MKVKFMFVLCIALTALASVSMPAAMSEKELAYGHVSFVENQATVVRSDQTEDNAVVNLPLVPGDTIATGEHGRCELQFDNGTIVRLDSKTRLRITTLRAPTLTTRWNLTTLHLLHGQLYTLPQTYNRELFQIITPNAAVKLASRTAATIGFNSDFGTALHADAGKFEVLYGADSKAPKRGKVKSGQAFVIGTDHTMVMHNEKRELGFVAWNEYVDRHFKELHSGISKVPPRLKFGNNALREWAEKWSSLVGEWVYDELFGYVWRPVEERFAHSVRPFFNAEYVRINGRLFLVPQEAWGWVPAHMGTWVWLDRGWTWLPGEWFHAGVVEFFGIRTFPTMDYYFLMAYGDTIFLKNGLQGWRLDYLRRYYREVWEQLKESWVNRADPLGPKPKDLPHKLADIVKLAASLPMADGAKRFGPERVLSAIAANRLPPARHTESAATGSAAADRARLTPDKGAGNAGERSIDRGERQDWNPDRQWADARGYSIRYSSVRNAVVCLELNIASDRHSLLHSSGAARAVVPALGDGAGGSRVPESAERSAATDADARADKSRSNDQRSEKKDDSRN